MSKPTAEDMKKYKHIVFTSDTIWDPSILDNISVEEVGEIGAHMHDQDINSYAVDTKVNNPNFNELSKYFCYMPAEVVEKTFKQVHNTVG